MAAKGQPAANASGLSPDERRRLQRLAKRTQDTDAELHEAVREAAASGASLRAIADAIGRPHTTVAVWLRRDGAANGR